jgi:hypothetical protein
VIKDLLLGLLEWLIKKERVGKMDSHCVCWLSRRNVAEATERNCRIVRRLDHVPYTESHCLSLLMWSEKAEGQYTARAVYRYRCLMPTARGSASHSHYQA